VVVARKGFDLKGRGGGGTPPFLTVRAKIDRCGYESLQRGTSDGDKKRAKAGQEAGKCKALDSPGADLSVAIEVHKQCENSRTVL